MTDEPLLPFVTREQERGIYRNVPPIPVDPMWVSGVAPSQRRLAQGPYTVPTAPPVARPRPPSYTPDYALIEPHPTPKAQPASRPSWVVSIPDTAREPEPRPAPFLCREAPMAATSGALLFSSLAAFGAGQTWWGQCICLVVALCFLGWLGLEARREHTRKAELAQRVDPELEHGEPRVYCTAGHVSEPLAIDLQLSLAGPKETVAWICGECGNHRRVVQEEWRP